jgi:glycosyltransferase involved in cell wall biosynthesis
LQHEYDAVLQMDADGQHDPSNIKDFLAEYETGECDVILGSRHLGEGSYKPTLARAIGMKLFGWIARMATGRTFTDVTSGFQLLDCKVLRYFTKNDLFPQDYPDADILILLHYIGARIKEIPVQMHPDETNQSMHSGLLPFYYVFKMLISILIIICSRKELRSIHS